MSSLHSLTLSHFTNTPIETFVDVDAGSRGKGLYKPAGFWVSVDGEDDWPAWCTAESYGIGKLRYRIELAANANVLLLYSAEAISSFSREFGLSERQHYAGLDWGRVGERWDGLIIAPYQWDCRMDDDTFWYYTWDCASGVIWRPTRAIAVAEVFVAPETHSSNERGEANSATALKEGRT